MGLQAKTADAAWIISMDDPVIPALHAAALAAYAALDCGHYGLFDFRVDDAGDVWFLEAGLYCFFSPDSVICVMARAAGISLPDLFAALAAGVLGVSVETLDAGSVADVLHLPIADHRNGDTTTGQSFVRDSCVV